MPSEDGEPAADQTTEHGKAEVARAGPAGEEMPAQPADAEGSASAAVAAAAGSYGMQYVGPVPSTEEGVIAYVGGVPQRYPIFVGDIARDATDVRLLLSLPSFLLVVLWYVSALDEIMSRYLRHFSVCTCFNGFRSLHHICRSLHLLCQ